MFAQGVLFTMKWEVIGNDVRETIDLLCMGFSGRVDARCDDA